MSDQRVEIKFEHRFSRQSDNGKAFGWLKDYFGCAYDDAITNAVRFVYLPIALAEAGASRQEVEASIQKAKEFLNDKMMVALGSCCNPDEKGAVIHNSSTPVDSSSVNRADVAVKGKEQPHSSNGAGTSTSTAIDLGVATSSSPKTELIDDFLELDESKLMEGF